MPDKKKPVEVIINGMRISMISDESDIYVQQIADYINRKTEELEKKKRSVSTNSQLMKLLVAVNIADDLFKERIKTKNLEYEIDSYIEELRKVQEENIALKEKLNELQMTLDKTEKELQVYVDIFERD